MTEGSVVDESSAESPSLDQAALDRLVRFGGARLLSEMVRLFLEAVPERLAAARAGVDEGDAKATELALHSLKSSSAQLGAMQMQRLSETGERSARAGDLAVAGEMVHALEVEFVQVKKWLTSVRDGDKE